MTTTPDEIRAYCHKRGAEAERKREEFAGQGDEESAAFHWGQMVAFHAVIDEIDTRGEVPEEERPGKGMGFFGGDCAAEWWPGGTDR